MSPQALGREAYLTAAERCGQVVWSRGLLKKGYGLCHGVAGNGFTFLQLYRLTGQPYHLHRAIKVCITFNILVFFVCLLNTVGLWPHSSLSGAWQTRRERSQTQIGHSHFLKVKTKQLTWLGWMVISIFLLPLGLAGKLFYLSELCGEVKDARFPAFELPCVWFDCGHVPNPGWAVVMGSNCRFWSNVILITSQPNIRSIDCFAHYFGAVCITQIW